ncbi:hypothetical protein GCM10009551_096170 [Nocardiopsis tropica]|uniref:hypothetical protein n=1 Tax=Tsukamurella strandjordii TaxID=147577 RepID=UPI0031E35AAB
MTQPPNYPGDNQGGFPPPQDPQQPGGQPGQGFPPPPQQPAPGFPPPQGAQGFPPPQGAQGFPPPQPGQGYPPPPAGGYPPVQGGYGAPYGGPQKFNLGNGFSWAWNKFTKNALALIVPVIVYGIILGVIAGVGYSLVYSNGLDSVTTDDSGNMTAALNQTGTVEAIIFSLILTVVAYLITAAYVSGLFDIADGKQVGIGSFFKPRNAGQAILTAAVLGLVAGLVGSIPYVGFILQIVVGFIATFAILVVVDRGVSLADGVKQGLDVIKRDVGNSILVVVVAGLLVLVGSMCLVGSLIAVPVAGLLLVNAYRLISGGQVAPATP